MNSWDTDSNKPFDFLLNPIRKVAVCVALHTCHTLVYYTNKMKFKPNNLDTNQVPRCVGHDQGPKCNDYQETILIGKESRARKTNIYY